MMKKDWSKNLKKYFTSPGFDKEKREAFPSRDWRILVIMFMVVFILSLALHGYLFMMVNNDKIFVTVTKEDQPVAFNKENFERILNLFDQQDATFERLKSAPVTAVDPSL